MYRISPDARGGPESYWPDGETSARHWDRALVRADNPNKTYGRAYVRARPDTYECTHRRAAHFTRIMPPLLKHITGVRRARRAARPACRASVTPIGLIDHAFPWRPRRWAEHGARAAISFSISVDLPGLIDNRTTDTPDARCDNGQANEEPTSPDVAAIPQRYQQSADPPFFSGGDESETPREISPLKMRETCEATRMATVEIASLLEVFPADMCAYDVSFFPSTPVVRRLVDGALIEPRWDSPPANSLLPRIGTRSATSSRRRGLRLFRARLNICDVDSPRFHRARARAIDCGGHARPVPSAGYIRLLGIQLIARI